MAQETSADNEINAFAQIGRRFRKVQIKFTDTEIIVSNNDLGQEIFRSKLSQTIIGDNFIATGTESNRIKSVVIKGPDGRIQLLFANPYYLRFLLFSALFIYFGGLSLLGVNPFQIATAIPFAAIGVPAIFALANKINKTHNSREQFANSLEKAIETNHIQFAAVGNEIAAVADENAGKAIKAQYAGHVWTAGFIAVLLFLLGSVMTFVVPSIILGNFIDDKSVITILSSGITLLLTIPLTWSYYKSVKQAAKKHLTESLEAVEDELISSGEFSKLNTGSWLAVKAGWIQLAVLMFVPMIAMIIAISTLPKLDSQAGQQVSQMFLNSLREGDYDTSGKLLCSRIKDDVAVFDINIKKTGQGTFETLDGFDYAITHSMGPQMTHYIYKNPRYPKLSFDTVVKQEAKGPCISFALLPLGFMTVEVGETTHDYLREPGIDEPRKTPINKR